MLSAVDRQDAAGDRRGREQERDRRGDVLGRRARGEERAGAFADPDGREHGTGRDGVDAEAGTRRARSAQRFIAERSLGARIVVRRAYPKC